MARTFCIVSIVLTVVAVAPVARADDASEARLHNQMAQNLYEQRRFEEAIQHFLASNRLVPNPGVTLNIARIYGVMERWVDSYNWYETYLREFELDEPARASAQTARDSYLPRVAVLDVTSRPAGASLFVNRTELGSVGLAPRRVAVEAGEHVIVARLDGHHEARLAVSAVLGTVNEIEIELRAILGTLSVQTDPVGVEVRLEGRESPLGLTPLEVPLPVGTHHVSLFHPGFSEMTREVSIAEGQTARLELTLSRIASTVAVLSVSSPARAEVLVDGRRVGQAPFTADDLAPGRHRVELRMDGRQSWSDELVLEAGGATRVAAVLEDPSALHFEDLRYIGYGGGGALVLAGLGVALGGFLEREAFFASPNPSRSDLDQVGDLSVAADVLWISGLVVLGTTLIVDLIVGSRPVSRAEVVVDR